MASSIFQTNPESVSAMLADISNGKLVLPEFQRDFRWETDRTARLLSSVLARFPTGALLFWSQATSARGKTTVGKRAIEGAHDKSVPTFRFILDGQQRLTALYRALNGASEEERYFVSIEALLDLKTLAVRDEADIDWDAIVIDRELTAKEKRDLAKARKAAVDVAKRMGGNPRPFWLSTIQLLIRPLTGSFPSTGFMISTIGLMTIYFRSFQPGSTRRLSRKPCALCMTNG